MDGGYEKPVTVGLKREQAAEVYKEAWKAAKEAGRTRPTAKDMLDARKALGFPPLLGAGPAQDTEELVGLTTKGFRIASGTEVVRLLTDGSCTKGHYWSKDSTVYSRRQRPMCPLCGSVIQ